MNHQSETRRALILSTCAILIAILTNGIGAAQPHESQQTQSSPPASSAQNPPSPQQAPATSDDGGAKKRKVWTNEDLIALRTPADIYILEQEAREAAEAEAAEKAAEKETAAKASANPANQAGSEVQLPGTKEETEKRVKDTETDLEDDNATIAKLKGELADAPTEQKAEKQKQIDHLTTDIEVLQRDLQALQEHLKTFAPKPDEQAPPSAAPPQAE